MLLERKHLSAVLLLAGSGICAAADSVAAPPRHDSPPTASSRDADDVAKRKIRENVSALLTKAGSVTSIDVGLNLGDTSIAGYSIKDPKAIARICASLRDVIGADQFSIGKQFFSPKEVLEITWQPQTRMPLRLLYVGDAMFWVSWNDEMRRANADINLQATRFETQFFAGFGDQSIPPDFLLEIVRRGCEGKCPSYSIRLDSQGHINWHGNQFVNVTGDAQVTIDLTRLRFILMRAREQQVMTLSGKGVQCLDTPSVELKMTANGRTMSATHDSCSQQKTPKGRAIAEFARFAERIMETERWVKAP